MARKDGTPRSAPMTPRPPASGITPRARVIAAQTGVTAEQAQRGLDRGWLR